MSAPDYEARYRQAPCGLVSTTVEGVVLDVNDTMLAWIGRREADVVGQRFTQLLDAGSRLFFETRHAQILHLQGSVREVALTLATAAGGTLPVLVNSVLVDGPAGAVIRTALFDATDRLQYESELLRARQSAESSEARVRVLQDVSDRFGVSVTDADVVESFVTVAREAFAATDAGVLLLDENGELELVAGANPLDGLVPPVQRLRNTPVVLVVHADDVESEFPLLAAGLRTARLEALSITPLLDEHERLGVLVCFFARRRDFDEPFFDLQRALGRQASQTLVRVRLQRRLEQLALFDQLTGLPNRQVLQQGLDAAIERADETGAPIAVIFLDVDAFKAVNDRWGHAAGDEVLRELAARLRMGVRADDIVARIGGDEFVAVCADVDVDGAYAVAERILAGTRHPLFVGDTAVQVSMSAGVAMYRPGIDPRPTGDKLLIRADGAMYHAKGSGKDRVTMEPEAKAETAAPD